MSQAIVQTRSPLEQANGVLQSLYFGPSLRSAGLSGIRSTARDTEQLRVNLTLERLDDRSWQVTVTISPLADAPHDVASRLDGHWLSVETGFEIPEQTLITPATNRDHVATAQLVVALSEITDESKLTIH
jgi:hypothetical protein